MSVGTSQFLSVPQDVVTKQATQCGECDQEDRGGRADPPKLAELEEEERSGTLLLPDTDAGRCQSEGREQPAARATGQKSTLLDAVRLTPLMARTSGSPDLVIALLDGPVATRHPDLVGARIREVSTHHSGTSIGTRSHACAHGTFVAGILSARRNSAAPAICPDCTLLVRPIFEDVAGAIPSATPEELSDAIVECVEAGASVVNLSVDLALSSTRSERSLSLALDHAMRHGVVVVAAAGNQGTLASSPITRHPWVIPVVACDVDGRLTAPSNLSQSIGRNGLGAPGVGVVSLGIDSVATESGGTSVAAPFVAGTVALLWSLFPSAPATEVKRAVTGLPFPVRRRLVPPLLDAWTAYQVMARMRR
jgi:subtilisin family serine protease